MPLIQIFLILQVSVGYNGSYWKKKNGTITWESMIGLDTRFFHRSVSASYILLLIINCANTGSYAS